MKSFIEQVAERLYDEYGENISTLNILFPNRRAQLFFNNALSEIADKPLWQPTFITVDEVMEEQSGLVVGDQIRLITELYDIYAHHHDESFDTFYFWGEMLLADFDSIDKYLIDADMLFRNISELKNIEADLSYLTSEQIEVISKFWQTVDSDVKFSPEKQQFVKIWYTLAPIYHQFKSRISTERIAYTGMIHRKVAELIKEGGQLKGEFKERYVIIGFNALSECEKVLFAHMEKCCEVDFFWDYDHYYVDNPEQEAGLFLRDNIKRFPQRVDIDCRYSSFSEPKEINVIASPSDSLQCKYVSSFIRAIIERTGKVPEKETAIVLTDENLLIPTLHAIPSEVDKINVTMGYPLRMTAAYTFVERLIELQLRKKVSNSKFVFYHSDVSGLLTHPFIMTTHPELATELAKEIVERQQIYIAISHLDGGGHSIMSTMFSPVEEWGNFAQYLKKVIDKILNLFTEVDHKKEDSHIKISTSEYYQLVEFLSIIAENINKLQNTLDECRVEMSLKMFASLLRKVLQNVKVPYEGEPLEGVQVMGILETRNLDFENVLILSVNDDTFPGNRSVSSSFIPYNLRFAYGLPTPQHHEGVYAYYFYRLLQRAKNVDIVYSSRSDEKSNGEQSRYIYQLEYESPHSINRRTIRLDVSHEKREPIVVEKSGKVWEQMGNFLGTENNEPVRLSPTAFSNYIACPLKFYFYSIARLATEDQVSEEIDAPMFGSILHGAMNTLYQPAVGVAEPYKTVAGITQEQVQRAVNGAIVEEFFNGEQIDESSYSGNLLLIKDIVTRYISTCVVPFDSRKRNYKIERLEERIQSSFEFIDNEGKQQRVLFGGIADRIDVLDGAIWQVVDYKSGKERLEFKGMDQLFSETHSEQNPAALQILLYAMMLNRTTNADVQPALYFVRDLINSDYSPLLVNGETKAEVNSYIDNREKFESLLSNTLSELFDKSVPFRQCEDEAHCQWCDFSTVCGITKKDNSY